MELLNIYGAIGALLIGIVLGLTGGGGGGAVDNGTNEGLSNGNASGGGASNTKSTESAQCVYAQAYWDNKGTKFTPEDLTTAYNKVKVNGTLDNVLNISDELQKQKYANFILKKSLLIVLRYSTFLAFLK